MREAKARKKTRGQEDEGEGGGKGNNQGGKKKETEGSRGGRGEVGDAAIVGTAPAGQEEVMQHMRRETKLDTAAAAARHAEGTGTAGWHLLAAARCLISLS
jgi:hypothetical protein